MVNNKHVRFNDKVSCKFLHVWNFASREARRNMWEQYALDRWRFRGRINKVNLEIGYIFDINHRHNIFNDRFKMELGVE